MATWNNAVNLGLSETIGNLKPGMKADIAVFRPRGEKNILGDRPESNPECMRMEGTLVYEPVITVKNGEMVYRSVMF